MKKVNEEIYIIDEHERGKLIAMARGFIGCNREKDGFFAEEYMQFLNGVASKNPVEVITEGILCIHEGDIGIAVEETGKSGGYHINFVEIGYEIYDKHKGKKGKIIFMEDKE